MERVREGDAFRVGPTYTTADLMFTFDAQRAESPWLRFTDTRSGRDLDFRVVVVRGGFLKGLEGRTVDGNPWPEDWAVDPAQARVESEGPPYLVLPSEADIAKAQEAARSGLINWLGLTRLGDVETFPPASEAALAAREREVGQYSPSYRAFLAITDGFESHLLRLLGHSDSYPLDSVHLPALLVAWDSDDQGDYVVAVPLGGSDDQVYRIDVHDESAVPRPIAPSLGAYLTRRLTELGLASEAVTLDSRDPLGAFTAEAEAEELVGRLASEDPAVRASAALRLAFVDAPSSTAHLRRLLREDPDRRVRSMAGQSLLTRGDAGSMADVSRFIEEMSKSDVKGALEAAYPVASALAIHVRHARTGLAPRLGDGDLELVASALQALVDSASKQRSRLARELSLMLESVREHSNAPPDEAVEP